MRRAPTVALLLVGIWIGNHSVTVGDSATDPYALVEAMLSKKRSERAAAAEKLAAMADQTVIPALVDAVFFTPSHSRREIFALLNSLTGESIDDYYDWVEWVGAHSEIEPFAEYTAWKLSLLKRIDPRYTEVIYPGAPSRIRLEEVVWGGVPLAGIPALDDPPVIAGEEAKYLRKREQVFGLVVNGESRAYPLRILSWHELLNDRLGGQPIALSYCTLCGAGIFFSTRTPDGGSYRFDTSGLLYRSNKLMVDRQSLTLWSNLTGEPVLGRLAEKPLRLEMLPGTLTTWESWLAKHPRTTVLDLKGVRNEMQPQFNFDYRPGAADLSRRGVSFPVWLKSDLLERDRQVFTLRFPEGAKAYPIDLVVEAGVINDQIGSETLVLIGESGSGAVRAYRRGDRVFERDEEDGLRDQAGDRWQVEEEALRKLGDEAASSILARLPGNVALWFGWFGFYPQTEVWTGQDRGINGVD